MNLSITAHKVNVVKYLVRSMQDKHGYSESITCSKCKVWDSEENLSWVNLVSLEQDFDGVPLCRKCYQAAMGSVDYSYYKLAA